MRDLARAIENLSKNGLQISHDVNIKFDRTSVLTLGASIVAAGALTHFIRKL
jgi:hypothetical protein